jgi:hypothetical protein
MLLCGTYSNIYSLVGGCVMLEKYTVVIADDHTILRDGLKALLYDSDDLREIGEAIYIITSR